MGPGLSRVPSLFDQRSPAVWATHVKVPVFLVGALEDEQTGPQWPVLITALSHDKNVYATMLNGTHIDSLGPDTLSRWLEFLDIYVAGRVPTQNPFLTLLAPAVYAQATGGAKSMAPPPVRFTERRLGVRRPSPTSRPKTPASGCSSTTGAATSGPGPCSPPSKPTTPRGRPAEPSPATTSGRGGTLTSAKGSATHASFRPDPSVRPATDLPTGNAWAAQPPYNWTTVPAANGVAFETPPSPRPPRSWARPAWTCGCGPRRRPPTSR